MRDLKGVFLDIFGGVGGVAKSASALGAHAEVWDTSFGNEYDLARPRVLRRLLHRIRKGNILGAAIAMPCKSFSLARARRGAIRTKLWPWGIPEILESGDGRDFDDLIEGNLVLKATIKIIQELNKRQIPWVWENPLTSYAGHVAQLQRARIQAHGFVSVIDQCSCGTPWKKPTQLWFGNWKNWTWASSKTILLDAAVSAVRAASAVVNMSFSRAAIEPGQPRFTRKSFVNFLRAGSCPEPHTPNIDFMVMRDPVIVPEISDEISKGPL